jgi:hypothetical protein
MWQARCNSPNRKEEPAMHRVLTAGRRVVAFGLAVVLEDPDETPIGVSGQAPPWIPGTSRQIRS